MDFGRKKDVSVAQAALMDIFRFLVAAEQHTADINVYNVNRKYVKTNFYFYFVLVSIMNTQTFSIRLMGNTVGQDFLSQAPFTQLQMFVYCACKRDMDV